jgi:hypothetical protein
MLKPRLAPVLLYERHDTAVSRRIQEILIPLLQHVPGRSTAPMIDQRGSRIPAAA